MIGQTVGHYRILGKLGEGGMGIVYLAEDDRLHRKVALKMLPANFADDAVRLARFEREVRTVAALNHPNIITIHSVEEVDGVRFFTMEHLEGKTLSQLIPVGGLPLAEFLRIAVPLAEALAAAHAKGIQHRDLKPSNVMVSPEGRVKVLDFGLAKLKEHERTEAFEFKPETTLTQAGLAIGTLAYMSPEQLRMNPTDHRSDIFSLGVVLFEMASGRCPFLGQSTAEVISSILRDQPTRAYEDDAEVPAELDKILRRCLEKEPALRWQSAAELRDTLASAERNLTLGTAATKTTSRQAVTRRFSRRALGLAGAAAGILLLALVLGYGLSRRGTTAPSEAATTSGPSGGAKTPVAAAVPSIAVLPLVSFSGDPEYFVDGFTDGLIGALGHLRGVRVISRQSAMHYKASNKRLPEIANELGVEYLVEGSLAQNGNRLHVQTRLVRADPEEQVWADVLDRPADSVLALHNELAAAIVRAASGTILPVEEERMAATRKVDPEVYQEFLQGRFFVDQGRPESIEKARLAFERAIQLDPTFAPAHAGLADVYGWRAYLFDEPLANAARMEASARRAIELDPTLAYAHAHLGDVFRYYRWDWERAEMAYRRAIDLNPNDAVARRYYWALLASLGRFAEAREQIEVALRIDPLSAASYANRAYLDLFEGRRGAAETSFRRALEMDPSIHWAHSGLWLLDDRPGQERERLAELRAWLAGVEEKELLAAFDAMPAGSSHQSTARRVGRLAEELSTKRRMSIGLGASLLVSAGEFDRAEAWLVRAYENRDPELVWLAMDPAWAPLRSRPRIRQMLAEMKLPAPTS